MMPEDKVISSEDTGGTPKNTRNLVGTIEGFPMIPDVPVSSGLPEGYGGIPGGELSPREIFARNASKYLQEPKQISYLPVSSIYTGDRYKSSRPFENVEEAYGKQQSSLDKIGNGIGKLAGVTATTFLSGTAGLIYGIGQASNSGKFSDLWNNDLNKRFDQFNTAMEDKLPNYYTQAEKDSEWWQPANILTANFFSDKLVKNFGYALGALAGGAAWAKLLKGISSINSVVKAGQGLEALTAVESAMATVPKVQKITAFENALSSIAQKYVKNPIASVMNNGERITTSVMGTWGEASMESLQNANSFRANAIEKYKEEYGYAPTGADLAEIESYTESVGNFTLGMNVALLSATSYIQLPKILGSSRKADKLLINDIVQDAETGIFSAYKPTTKVGRLLSNVKNVSGLFFSPSEAFEEAGQFAIQTGTQDFFNRAYRDSKETNEFIATLGSVLSNISDFGVDQVFNSKEGMESILLGGVSGGLQQSGVLGTYRDAKGKAKFGIGKSGEIAERGVFGTGGERASNTTIAVNALNKTKLPDVLKSRMNYVGIALNSQKLRQEAIRANDTLAEKDFEHDYVLSYVMPRAKYGREASVQQELSYYQSQAATDQGYDELVTAGIANANEKKEQFIGRIENLKKISKSVAALYETLNDKYENTLDDQGKKKYSDYIIDKMVYAAAKIGNYDERIPQVNGKLAQNGINTLDVLQSMIGKNAPNAEATKNALEQINNLKTAEGLDVPKELKDSLKSDLIDVMELAERRRKFIGEYDEMKESPNEYEYVYDEYEDDEFATIKQLEKNEGDKRAKTTSKEVEVGKEYSLAEPFRREGSQLQLAPKMTVLSKTLGGEYEVRLPNGQVTFLTPSEFKNYKITDADNTDQGYADILDAAITKVLGKAKYADIAGTIPVGEDAGKSLVEWVNEQNNPELAREIQKEFNAQAEAYTKIKEEENAALEDEQLADDLIELTNDEEAEEIADNENEAGEDSRKPDKVVISASIPSQKIPGYKRSIKFANKFYSLPTSVRENLYAVFVTAKNQAKLIPGLVEHLAQGNKKIKTDTTIAAVIVEKQADGTSRLVGVDGNVLEAGQNPLENAIFQVMPLEGLKWSEDFNDETMFRDDTNKEQYKAIYAKRRAAILDNPDLVQRGFDVSMGIAKEKVDNSTPVKAAGLVTDAQLEDKAVLTIPTLGVDVLAMGSTSFKKPQGMVFLDQPNGHVRLYTSKITKKQAETIYDVLMQLSKTVMKYKGVTDEAEPMIDWLRTTLQWGSPKEGKQPGRSSVWFAKDAERKTDRLRLYFGAAKMDMAFKPTVLEKQKETILKTLMELNHNVNKKQSENTNDPYTEITGVATDGKLETKDWQNYQTYLLSAEGRGEEDIPLTTKLDALADSEDGINRISNYFVMKDFNDDEEFAPPAKPKTTKKTATPEAPTAPKTGMNVFGFALASTGDREDVDYKVNADGSVKISNSAANEAVFEKLSKDELTLEKFRDKYDELYEGGAFAVASDELEPIEIIKQVAQERIENYLAQTAAVEEQEAKENKMLSMLRAMDASRGMGEEEEEAPTTAAEEETPNVTPEVDKAAAKSLRSKILKGNSNYDARVRLDGLIKNFKGEDWAKVEEWLEKNYSNGVTRVKTVLRNTNGRQYWGIFKDGMVYVYKNAEAGTVYHEVFHAIFNTILTPRERARLREEFRRREGTFVDRPTGDTIKYSEATDAQIKEQLPEEFREYLADGTVPPKPTKARSGILGFFQDIIDMVKKFFTGKDARFHTEELFKNINTGGFKTYNPNAATLALGGKTITDIDELIFSGDADPSLITAGLTPDIINDIMHEMTYGTLRVLGAEGKSLFEVENLDRKELFEKLKLNIDTVVYDNLEEMANASVEDGTYTQEDVDPILADAKALKDVINSKWDVITTKFEEEYLSSYSVKLDENDEDEIKNEEKTGKEGTYSSPEKLDSFRKTTAAIKLFLATVPVKNPDGSNKVSSIGGVNLIPMGKVYNDILNAVNGSTGIDDMLEKFRMFTLNSSQYKRLYSRLTNNLNNELKQNPFQNIRTDGQMQLVSAFFTAFNLNNPDVKTTYILQGGEVSVGDTSLAGATEQAASQIENSIVDAIKSGKFFTYNGKSFVQKRKALLDVRTGRLEDNINFMEDLGVIFDLQEMERLPYGIQQKFIIASTGIRDNLLEVTATKELNKKALKLGTRLRELGEIQAMIDRPDFQTTYFNLDGDQVQSYIGQNLLSDFYNVISSVSNKNQLKNTKFSYLLTDNFSASSVMMDRIFNPKTGDKREGVTKLMKVGYTGGVVNEITGKDRASGKLLYSERLIEELNLNLKGYYMNLVSGDSSLGWMLTMGNQVSQAEILKGNDKTLSIFKGYLASEIAVSKEKRKGLPEIEGRKNTDLRFFKGILGPVLHDKVVAFVNANKNATIDDVYAQFTTANNKTYEADKLTPIEQNFADGQGGRRMQSKFAGKSTMDLILSGDRTRTTRANTDIQRMLKDYGLTRIENLVGKVIRMTDKQGRVAYTEITKVAPFTKEYQDATWRQEGWEKSVTDKLVGEYPYAIEFKLSETTEVNNIDAAILKYIDNNVNSRIKNYTAQGLITEREPGVYFVKNIEFSNKSNLGLQQLKNNVKMLAVNYMINTIELHKLIYSDPYLYKDELKRIKNFSSPAKDLVSGSKEYNNAQNVIANEDYEKGDIGYTDETKDSLSSVVFDDVDAIEDLENYKVHKETDGGGMIMMKANRRVRKRAGDWNKFEEQQYRYDVAWEKRDKRIGLSPREVALLEKGNPKVTSAYTPLKPIARGRKANNKKYNDIMLDKFALYVYSYRILKEINATSNALKMYDKMQKADIDYGVFKSGRKVGAEKTIPLYNADGTFNSAAVNKKTEITEVPLGILAIQSEVPSKEDEKVRRGTQPTKLVTLDFLDCGLPFDFMGDASLEDRIDAWKELSEDQKRKASDTYRMVRTNDDLVRKITDNNYKSLLNQIGYKDGKLDLQSLGKYLRKQIVKGNANENILKAVDSLIAGNKDIEATPAYQQIVNTLYSIAQNTFATPKMTGGMKVQISSALLESVRGEKKTINGKEAFTSDVLKFYRNKKGERVCEIMIRRWFKSDMSDEALLKYLNTDEGQKILSSVGFRTPTQKQNSIDRFVVKKFLPQEFGDSIVVPSALVAKAGSDFDIDKLSIYLKNIYKDPNGKVRLIKSYDSKKESDKDAEKIFNDILARKISDKEAQAVKNEGLQNIIESIEFRTANKKTVTKWTPIFREMFGDDASAMDIQESLMNRLKKIDKQLDKLNDEDIQAALLEEFKENFYSKSLENAYIESMEELISSEQNFARLTKPNNAELLQKIARKIVIKKFGKEFDYTNTTNLLDQTFMSTIRYAFVSGKYAIGIAAQAQTNHALNQRGVIIVDHRKYVSPQDALWLGDKKVYFSNFNKLKVGKEVFPLLSRVKDANDEHDISDIIGQFIDGYVDIAAGPWVMELGAGPVVAPTWLFLVKIGVPIQEVADFMNQPAILDYLKQLQASGYPYLFSREAFDKVRVSNKYRVGEGGFKTKGMTLPSGRELSNAVGKDKLDDKEKLQQVYILTEFLKYSKMAEHLFRVTQATKFDTANINNPDSLYKMSSAVGENSNSEFSNNLIGSATNNILDNSFIGEIFNKYIDIRNVYAEAIVSERRDNREAINDQLLSKYKYLGDRKFTKLAKKIRNNIFDFSVQTISDYNKAIGGSLVYDNNTAKQIRDFVEKVKGDEDHELYNNLIINSFQYQPSEYEGGADSIKLTGKDNKTYDQNQIIYSFAQLKEYLKANNQLDLYKGLITLSVVQSGLNNSPISFTGFIPYEDFREVYADVMSKLNPTTIARFAAVNAFERNNWNNPDVVSFKKPRVVYDEEGFGTSDLRSTITLQHEGLQAAMERGEFPQMLNIALRDRAARKDFLVYTWEEGTIEEKQALKDANDFSYIKKGLFKKVYDETTGKPLIYGIKKSFIYKQVNAWGDSFRANEFYDHARVSQINNGFDPVDFEKADYEIAGYINNDQIQKDIRKGYQTGPTDEDLQANFENNLMEDEDNLTYEEEIPEEMLSSQRIDPSNMTYQTVYKLVDATDSPDNAYGLALQYIASGGKVSEESLYKEVIATRDDRLAAKKRTRDEFKARDYMAKNVMSITETGESIWQSLDEDLQNKITDQDVINALLDVVGSFNTRLGAAREFVSKFSTEDDAARITKGNIISIDDNTTLLKNGQVYDNSDINSKLLEEMNYTPKQIAKILKEIC